MPAKKTTSPRSVSAQKKKKRKEKERAGTEKQERRRDGIANAVASLPLTACSTNRLRLGRFISAIQCVELYISPWARLSKLKAARSHIMMRGPPNRNKGGQDKKTTRKGILGSTMKTKTRVANKFKNSAYARRSSD